MQRAWRLRFCTQRRDRDGGRERQRDTKRDRDRRRDRERHREIRRERGGETDRGRERDRDTERQRQGIGGSSSPHTASVSGLEGPLEREGVQIQTRQFLW